MSEGKKVKIGDLLIRNKETIVLNDSKLYKRVTVRLWNKGVNTRDEVLGSNILTKKQYIVKTGQFILSKIDARNGAFGIIPDYLDNAVTSADFLSYHVDMKRLNIEWFNLYTSTSDFNEICIKSSMGTTNRKRLNEDKFLNYELTLPSIKVQNELIDAYKTRKCKVDDFNNEIENQETYIKQLGQAILQEAVQGKLVPQDPNDEPASELLKKIKAEKEKLIKEGKIKKEKPLLPITEAEIPYDSPQGWEWVRWNDLLSFDKYSMKRGPFGSSLKKDYFVKQGIRVFEQYNAINDDPYWSRYYITDEKYEELKAFTAKAGDLLISCSGVTLGRITEIPEDTELGVINQALLKLNLHKSIILNEFFKKLFKSNHMQSQIFDMALGSAIPNMVGVVELKKILIPLPPIEEQKRIVQKVDELMQLCDELEEQIKQSKQHSEQLMQSILQEAFSSEKELVGI